MRIHSVLGTKPFYMSQKSKLLQLPIIAERGPCALLLLLPTFSISFCLSIEDLAYCWSFIYISRCLLKKTGA